MLLHLEFSVMKASADLNGVKPQIQTNHLPPCQGLQAFDSIFYGHFPA